MTTRLRCFLLLLNIMLISALSSNEKILFLHVPKTAGITIAYLLEKNFSLEEINSKQPLLIAYGIHHTLYEIQPDVQDYKLITFLRHPVDRVLSEQRFCMEKYRGLPYILQGHFLPPQGEPIHTAQNVVCKILSGLDPKDSTIPIEKHLKAAKRNLSRDFFFVGITEKLDKSIELLYSALNWPPTNEIPYFNSTNKTKELYPKETIELIEKQNWADIELYEFAVSIFNEREKTFPIKNVNIHRDPTPRIGNAKQLVYNFDMPLDGSGWCLRDYLKDGHSYRWVSSKNRAFIFFDLNPVNYILEFRMRMHHSFLSNFRLAINGSAVPLEFKIEPLEGIEDEFTWVNFKAEVTSNLIKPGCKTELSFEVVEPEDLESREIFRKATPEDLPIRNFERGKCALSYLCFTEE